MQIAIDLDVHKELEKRRSSFEQKANDILREILALNKIEEPKVVVSVQLPAERSSRTTGRYVVDVGGREITAGNLKGILKSTVLSIDRMQPRFVEKLSQHRTSRGRRIVARKPQEVYPGKPNLTEKAEQLRTGWWFDTNISLIACRKYLEVIAKISGVEIGRLEKTLPNLEDLL